MSLENSCFVSVPLPESRSLLLKGLLVLGLLVGLEGEATQQARAHEPIFGIGPRTIWQHGFGLGVGLERDVTSLEGHWGLDYHLAYGITERWGVTAEIHQEELGHQAFGSSFGNLRLRSKYRFYLNNIPGGVLHVAALGGLELPTGTTEHSAETTDLFGGLAAGYEGRRWLAFTSGRYRINRPVENTDRGDIFLYDMALGLRPVKTDYYQPDVVLMAEINGQVFGEMTRAGHRHQNGHRNQHEPLSSGGHRLLGGVGAWITYRNWAVKPGIQIPLYNTLSGSNLDYHAVLEVEFHI
jgi:hypothetical protein